MFKKKKNQQEEVTLENLTERFLQKNEIKNEDLTKKKALQNQKEIQIKIEENKKAETIVKKAINNEDVKSKRKGIKTKRK